MNEDWREEVLNRLSNSQLYKELVIKCREDASGDHVLSLIKDVSYYSFQRTKTILKHMNEFTLHDSDHLFRVLKLMENLISPTNIEKLTITELMLLILSAFMHDIGMAPDEDTIIAWKKSWDLSPEFASDNEEIEYNKFKRYINARPDKVALINDFIEQGKITQSDIFKGYLISDYIRETHSNRSKEIVNRDWSEKIKYKDTDLTSELAEICYSHNENALALLDLEKQHLCGHGIYACLPMIAVILRLADILDFDAKRTPEILFSHLSVKNPVSLQEWNKHRAIGAWFISSNLIQFHAKCTHPAIEASIHAFCNIIDSELSGCNNVITAINQYNRSIQRDMSIYIPFNVDRSKITTKKDILGKPLYLYRNSQFNLNKNQVMDLLMGTKLYGDPEVALRELLQNSIDACLLRRALENQWGNSYLPEIKVRYSVEKNEDVLEIIDNGTGMDQHIVDTYYSKVGSSFYKSSEFYDLKSESKADFVPTSRFGIGMLSCFMVADTIVVDTRRVLGAHKSNDPINLTIEGQESIFWIREGDKETPGTTTKLILRKGKNPWDRMSDEQFINSVENVIPNPPFKIYIESAEKVKIRDENSFKELTASLLENKDDSSSKENIKRIEITINIKGIVGSAIVYVLESHGNPVEKIILPTKRVEIDGEGFNLEKSISLEKNDIKMNSTSISINDDGEVEQSITNSSLANSKARLSLHGIEVPTSIFPEWWRTQNNQVKIDWPLPVILVVDVCGNRDLDLNSSRTQVILSEKWNSFEEELAFIICENIESAVDEAYWDSLKDIFAKNCKSDNFLNGLNRVKSGAR